MRRLMIVLIALMLLAAACGGSSDDDESLDAASTTTPETTIEEAPASATTSGPPTTRTPAPTIPRPDPTVPPAGSPQADPGTCNSQAMADALSVDEASVDVFECENSLAFARIGGPTAIVSTYLLQSSGPGWAVVAQLELQPEACAANGAPSSWCAGFGPSGGGDGGDGDGDSIGEGGDDEGF